MERQRHVAPMHHPPEGKKMSETPYATGADDELDDLDVLDTEDDLGGQMPGRQRRRFLNGWSAGAFVLLACAIGFYVGIRVEKSHVSSTGSSLASAFASRASSAKSTKSGSSTTSRTSFPGVSRSGASGFGGAGSGTTGTVSSIDGDTLYVKETDGNTVKVKLLGDTTIDKTVTVAKGKVYPGDSVVIEGASGSGGVIDATSLTDSGDTSSSSSSSSSTSSSSGSTSGSSSISSLFGG